MAIIGADSTMRSNHKPGIVALRSRMLPPIECAKPDERRRAVRQHDILHEADEVAVVLPEAAHVALARIRQHALRAALAAPVHGRDGKAAAAQIGDDLEVLFDELGAAAEQADGAAARHARRIPARVAQLGSVVALETLPRFRRSEPGSWRAIPAASSPLSRWPTLRRHHTDGEERRHGWLKAVSFAQ